MKKIYKFLILLNSVIAIVLFISSINLLHIVYFNEKIGFRTSLFFNMKLDNDLIFDIALFFQYTSIILLTIIIIILISFF